MKCYVDGKECTCGAYDVATCCPRDTHEEDNRFDDEDFVVEANLANQSHQLDGDFNG